MAILSYAKERLRSVIAEIDRAHEAEFPYPDSARALDLLQRRFQDQLKILDNLIEENNPSVVANECGVVLRDILTYLPLVGFILRSTTVRNAFEAWGPFLRLAMCILEPGIPMKMRQTQLVLSSEWDYIPIMYHRVVQLEHFLFIGLPAPESSNPLLLPLTGHELGHAIWYQGKLAKSLSKPAQESVVRAIQQHWDDYIANFPEAVGADKESLTENLLTINSIRQATEWCLKQAEETFCDLVALKIFGESYLFAFGYLLSPGIGTRSRYYPETTVRVARMLSVAAQLGTEAPASLSSLFDKDSELLGSTTERFLLTMADVAMELLTHSVLGEARRATSDSPPRHAAEAIRVLSRFRYGIPAEDCKTVADILNAAWQAYNEGTFWMEQPEFTAKKPELLKELVLKNLEIFEVEQIQKE